MKGLASTARNSNFILMLPCSECYGKTEMTEDPPVENNLCLGNGTGVVQGNQFVNCIVSRQRYGYPDQDLISGGGKTMPANGEDMGCEGKREVKDGLSNW